MSELIVWRDQRSQTALHHALLQFVRDAYHFSDSSEVSIDSSSAELADRLIDHGCQLSALDDCGTSPFQRMLIQAISTPCYASRPLSSSRGSVDIDLSPATGQCNLELLAEETRVAKKLASVVRWWFNALMRAGHDLVDYIDDELFSCLDGVWSFEDETKENCWISAARTLSGLKTAWEYTQVGYEFDEEYEDADEEEDDEDGPHDTSYPMPGSWE